MPKLTAMTKLAATPSIAATSSGASNSEEAYNNEWLTCERSKEALGLVRVLRDPAQLRT